MTVPHQMTGLPEEEALYMGVEEVVEAMVVGSSWGEEPKGSREEVN